MVLVGQGWRLPLLGEGFGCTDIFAALSFALPLEMVPRQLWVSAEPLVTF